MTFLRFHISCPNGEIACSTAILWNFYPNWLKKKSDWNRLPRYLLDRLKLVILLNYLLQMQLYMMPANNPAGNSSYQAFPQYMAQPQPPNVMGQGIVEFFPPSLDCFYAYTWDMCNHLHSLSKLQSMMCNNIRNFSTRGYCSRCYNIYIVSYEEKVLTNHKFIYLVSLHWFYLSHVERNDVLCSFNAMTNI